MYQNLLEVVGVRSIVIWMLLNLLLLLLLLLLFLLLLLLLLLLLSSSMWAIGLIRLRIGIIGEPL